ncbi:hypothetical protein [Alteromonas gilva]|uniref:Uncharacterized protein n=1 Tax=Alteromonas gilva TaxID=2987522 RepID=A0ABT5L9Y6_9ALTE|nr:hypothetical protein [Alteromonas gilva]MDC8832987.1 hypothetical protein [Alteromonas gilva]
MNNSAAKLTIENQSLTPFKNGIHLQFIGSPEESLDWINHSATRIIFKSLTDGDANLLVELPSVLSVTPVSFAAQEDARTDINLSTLHLRIQVNHSFNMTATGLTMDDFVEVWKSGIYIFFSGDNEFHIHAPRNIKIGQPGRHLKNKLAVIDEIPAPLLAAVESIYDCEPADEEETNAWIAKTDNAKVRLAELRNSSIPKVISDEIELHLIQLDAVSKQLQATKRRLRKQPVFEAVRKNHLIQLMSEFIEQHHGKTCVREMEAKALQLANQSDAPAKPEHEQIFDQVQSHDLHSLLYPIFNNPSTANLPAHKCHKCNSRWKMHQTRHPSTNAKRFHVQCENCGFMSDTPYSSKGHGAVLAWNRANPDDRKSFKDVYFLGLRKLNAKEAKSQLFQVEKYLELMKSYATSLEQYSDDDKRSEINSIYGMIRFLSDAVLYSRHMIKIANKKNQVR